MLEEIHEGNGGQKRLEEAQGNNDISIQGENEAEAQVDRGLLTIARHALRDATTTPPTVHSPAPSFDEDYLMSLIV